MAVYEETINLGGNISDAAKAAAHQFGVLEKSVTATKDAITKAQATGNVAQYRKLTTELKSLQAAQSMIPKGLLAEVEAHKAAGLAKASAAKQAAAQAAEMKKQAAESKKAADAAQELAQQSGGLQAELAEVTGGLSIVVEAAAAVGAAFGAVVLAGMAMSLEAVEAKEKMLALFDALGGGAISGKETVAMLDQIGDKIGQTRAQLAPLAQGFITMGVTGKEELQGLTIAAASAGAMAEGGAEKFTKFMGQIKAAAETGQALKVPFKKLDAQLRGMGLNVGDLAKQMNMSTEALAAGLKAGTIDAGKLGDALTDAATNKGAGPLAQAGASLTNVFGKFKENISKMFEDVDVAPFLKEVKEMFDIFGQAQPSGRALKAGIGGFFSETFKIAKAVVPYVKHFLLDLVIYGLKAYIALKPIAKSFNEWRTSASGMKTIVNVFSMIAAVLITVATVIGIAVAAFVGLWAVMVGIGVVIWGFIAAVIAIPQMAGAALADFFGKAPQMAKDFIMGLVDGIKNGAGMVVDAVKGMASGAVDSFKGALGIHSPSKVMMQMGGHVASGAAAGIDDGAPDVHGASADLAKAAAGGFASGGSTPAAPGASGSGGGVSVTIEAGAIVIQGGNGASIVDLTEQAVALLFERIALQQGLG